MAAAAEVASWSMPAAVGPSASAGGRELRPIEIEADPAQQGRKIVRVLDRLGEGLEESTQLQQRRLDRPRHLVARPRCR